jgi:GntR family transcriptional regulator of arabinose operon
MMEKELTVLQNILNRNMVDGIIIEPTKSGIPNPNKALYDEIMKRNIPTIFMNSYYPGVDIPHVSMDDKEAGLIAVNHLIAAGHRRIAGIFKFDDIQGHLRYAGYTKGLQDANLKINAEDILCFDTEDLSNIDTNIGRILKRLEGCTACVCYNDQLALEIVRICMENNIGVPEQMSIVSIDNSDIAKLCEIPLTSVALPMVDLGKTLANNLLEKIKDSSFNATMEFRPLLVERESVKKLEDILPE